MALDELLGWADLVVIATAHAAIDWDAVSDRAPLVVDTVNASGARRVGKRRVRRLGAGWSPPA